MILTLARAIPRFERLVNKGERLGYAGLNAEGIVPPTQLPVLLTMAMVRADAEIASAISLRHSNVLDHDGAAQNTAIAARAERVGAVDIEITDGARGVILRGRGGLNRWRLRVDNVTGALSTEAVV